MTDKDGGSTNTALVAIVVLVIIVIIALLYYFSGWGDRNASSTDGLDLQTSQSQTLTPGNNDTQSISSQRSENTNRSL